MRVTFTRSMYVCAVALFVATSGPAVAAGRDVVSGRESQVERQATMRARMSTGQIQQILTRIRTDADTLRRTVLQTMPRGRATGNPRVAENDGILYAIDDVAQATDTLGLQVTRGQVWRRDVDDILRHGAELSRLVSAASFRSTINSSWVRLRADLDNLASAYSVAWDWGNPTYESDQYGSDWPLKGTYRLSRADSDDPQAIMNRALRGLAASDRARVSRQLEARLTPPDVISIDRDNDFVTVASSRAREFTFEANGEPRTEQGFGGQSVTTRATFHADELEVVTSGSGGSDFSVTFEPLNSGETLVVTRRLYTDVLDQPVRIRTTYRRSSTVADWNVFNGRTGGFGAGRGNASVMVPTGTIFVASLQQPINLRTARDGQRIALTVDNGPVGLGNAVIEGYVTPARTNNQAGMSIVFDRIRLRDGRAAEFWGTIESVRDPDGREILFDRVDPGDENRSQEAIQRGAIGAALGAIVGAVIGGGKGAAIGAAVGAGGGAGTVLIDGQNQGDLPRGTQFTIRSGTIDLQ